MYGPKTPIIFAPTVPIDNPVWRKHVGYVSIACKLTAKNVMAIQNFTTIMEYSEIELHSESSSSSQKQKKNKNNFINRLDGI